MESTATQRQDGAGQTAIPRLKVAIVTRTGRPSGARFAMAVGQSGHQISGIIAEKRSAMLWRAIRRLGIGGFLRKYPHAWLAARISNTIQTILGRRISGNSNVLAACPSAADTAKRFSAPYAEVSDLNSSDSLAILKQWNPDVLVVANAPVLKAHVMGTARLGGINFHSGHLPEYGGVASEFWAMFDGNTTAWATLHQVLPTLDSGDILAEEPVPIDASDTPETLHERCVARGVSMIGAVLDTMASGSCRPVRSPGPAVLRKWPSSQEHSALLRRLHATVIT